MKTQGADSGYEGTIYAVRMNGIMLTDNKVIDTLTLSGSTNLTDLKVGAKITGKTSNATSTVVSINGNTIGLGTVTGTFQVGEQLLFIATKTSSTLFTTHDATGLVSNLQSADPGFSLVAGANPYHLTFPATFPTGNTPDVDLPAGTTLKVEVEASNAAGKATATTNTITPA
jgi:hypothetical protein